MACQDCAGMERKYHEALQDGLNVRKERAQLQDRLLAQYDETERYLNKARSYMDRSDELLNKVESLEAQLQDARAAYFRALGWRKVCAVVAAALIMIVLVAIGRML